MGVCVCAPVCNDLDATQQREPADRKDNDPCSTSSLTETRFDPK